MKTLGLKKVQLGLTPHRDDPGAWEGVQAVSYTHLRAHETVLDLVCRLLLEKKKHTCHEHIIDMYKILLLTTREQETAYRCERQ